MIQVGSSVFTFVAAEIVFLLARAKDIEVAIKSSSQRTAEERRRVDRGLIRSLVLESVLLAPASAFLILQMSPIALERFPALSGNDATVHTILGVVSYGFPFLTVRRLMTRIALTALSEFEGSSTQTEPAQALDEGKKQASKETKRG